MDTNPVTGLPLLLLLLLVSSGQGEDLGNPEDKKYVLFWSIRKESALETRVLRVESDPLVWVPVLESRGEINSITNFNANLTHFDFRSLAAEPETRLMFWVDKALPHTSRLISVNVDATTVKVYTTRASREHIAIALDWVNMNLYWVDTDREANHIGVLSYTDRAATILHSNLAGPMDIGVDPVYRYLFWIEASIATIKRSSLNGDDVISIVTSSLLRPSVLTVDHVARRIIWLDEGTGIVESCDYDGTNRTRMWDVEDSATGVGTYAALETYKDFIFLALRNKATTHIVRKSTRTKTANINFQYQGQAPAPGEVTTHGLAMIAPDRHPVASSLCTNNKGGCTQICVDGVTTEVQCLCSIGYKLQSDGTSCLTEIVNDTFALFTDATSSAVYQLDLASGEIHALDVQFHDTPRGIHYHSRERKVYWVDPGNKVIRRATLDGQDEVFQLLQTDSDTYGLALDMERDRVYYADAGRHVIAYTDGRTVETVLELAASDLPHSIALDTHFRLMYWTNAGASPTIERATMDDGSQRVQLVNTELGSPTGLVVDFNDEVIFWCDAQLQRVERAKLDGSGRQTIIQQRVASQLSGLAIDADYLYITDWHKRYVTRVDRQSKATSRLGPAFFGQVEYITAYSTQWTNDPSVQSHPPETTPGATSPGNSEGSGEDPQTTSAGNTEGGGGNPLATPLVYAITAGVVAIVLIVTVGLVIIKFKSRRQSIPEANQHEDRVTEDGTRYAPLWVSFQSGDAQQVASSLGADPYRRFLSNGAL